MTRIEKSSIIKISRFQVSWEILILNVDAGKIVIDLVERNFPRDDKNVL
jgi:hypothetical protein